MNVQHQVTELKCQLDSLCQTVEQIQKSLSASADFSTSDIAEIIPTLNSDILDFDVSVGENNLQHKDILFDGTTLLEGYPTQEKIMTPELQVKRLTAQLTVAYKRIAQLEEQLLSRQNKHNGSEYIFS